MGIQYVTVKIDTTGLYQPLSSAVGVVGIIGEAPSAGAGFSNPTLFTRALTGAGSEPYARVIPVLRVDTGGVHAPLDPTGTAIANVAWQQPKDSKGNVIGPFQLADSSAATFAPLLVDTLTMTLRRSNGSVFQAGGKPAQIVLDAFSIADKTVTGAATFWGAPLDNTGQPVPNLLMKPDAAPASAFVDLTGAASPLTGPWGTRTAAPVNPKERTAPSITASPSASANWPNPLIWRSTTGLYRYGPTASTWEPRSTIHRRPWPISAIGRSILSAFPTILTRITSPHFAIT